MGSRPLEDVEVPVCGSTRASHLSLVAVVGSCLLEDNEVPVLGNILTRVFVPGAPLVPRTLDYVELAIRGSNRARPYSSVAPVSERPLKDF